MSASAGRYQYVRLSRFRKLIGESLCQSDFGVAPERTDPTTYACGGCETGIEHGNTVDATIRDTKVSQLRIDPT